MQSTSGFWFPARRHCWGWGMPIRWQGWAVLIAFFGMLGAGIILLPLGRYALEFTVYAAMLQYLLILVCHVKGEPRDSTCVHGERDA
jgi:hypothetical protein